MTSLIPRQSAQLSPPSTAPPGFSRIESRALNRQQNAEASRGLIAATRVQAAAMTAAVGIQCVGMLSREAAYQADGDPAVADRVNHIVDQFARYAGAEVARFGL